MCVSNMTLMIKLDAKHMFRKFHMTVFKDAVKHVANTSGTFVLLSYEMVLYAVKTF